MGEISPALKLAIKALQYRNGRKKASKSSLARDASARSLILNLVKDRIVSMGATRITQAVLCSELAHLLDGSSLQSLLRRMYDTPFGRSVIHHVSGGEDAVAAAAATVATQQGHDALAGAAVGAAYEKIGANAVASVVATLLRCGWDLMEVLTGRRQWRDFWRSFVVAAGVTAGGIVGWTAGAGAGGSVAAVAPWLAPSVAANVGAVCAFLGTVLGDYMAGAATARFVDWFLGESRGNNNKKPRRGRGAVMADGRKRERSGEGRSSRECAPRRSLVASSGRESARPPTQRVRRGSWMRARPRDAVDPYGGRSGRRESSISGRGNDHIGDEPSRRGDARVRRRRSVVYDGRRRRADSESDNGSDDSDNESDDSDSAYEDRPRRTRRIAPRTAGTIHSHQRGDNKQHHQHQPHDHDSSFPVLFLKERRNPNQHGAELEFRRRHARPRPYPYPSHTRVPGSGSGYGSAAPSNAPVRVRHRE